MDIDGQDYYIKPMNCPFHIKIYQSKRRSYRDLPMRWAELGTVYRYERSGVLHGLMRVRGFTQDDAHIFCTPDQIEDEILEVLRFSLRLLEAFGFAGVQGLPGDAARQGRRRAGALGPGHRVAEAGHRRGGAALRDGRGRAAPSTAPRSTSRSRMPWAASGR